MRTTRKFKQKYTVAGLIEQMYRRNDLLREASHRDHAHGVKMNPRTANIHASRNLTDLNRLKQILGISG
jgi:hypothetical protein